MLATTLNLHVIKLTCNYNKGLMTTSTQVVKTLVTLTENSPFLDYSKPGQSDHIIN